MKIKELIKLLEKYDGNLEVMKFEYELNEYFPLEADEMTREMKVYEIQGGFLPIDDAREICEDNEEEFDEDLIKEVFII